MRCGICKKDTGPVFKEKIRDYSLYECPVCAGQFWDPMKNPGADWYEKDVRYSFRNKNPLKTPEVNHREFLRDLPELGGKLLDIGMGTGNFLAAAIAKGYDGYGTDFDNDAIETAKEFFGLKNVFALNTEESIKKFGKGYFDVITLFEVLEHLEDPSGSIEEMKMLLKKNGYLAISVPYRGSSKLFKAHDIPPRHLTRWSEESMEKFLNAHQFSAVRMKVIPVPFAYLITKYHFWYEGIFSFGMVEKMTSDKSVKKDDKNPEIENKIRRKMRILQFLARMKDYILFSIPASILYIRLFLTRKAGLDLYVLARYDR